MPTGPKIIAWDIETTNLSANFGYILCLGWKVIGENKTHLIKINEFDLFKKDPTNDKEVVAAAREILTDCDAWVTWYGSRFDEPFVNSRLLFHNLPPLPPMASAHIDGWRIAKYKMKLNSNRLASVSQFVGVEEKTPLSGPHWIKAMAGDSKSQKYVFTHCKQDVRVLEQVYEKIKVLHTGHINVNLNNPGNGLNCPRCGASSLERRGHRWSQVAKIQRFFCKKCSAWSSGRPERVKGIEAR